MTLINEISFILKKKHPVKDIVKCETETYLIKTYIPGSINDPTDHYNIELTTDISIHYHTTC